MDKEKCIARVKELAEKMHDDTETEVSFKPAASSSFSASSASSKRPRCDSSDDEDEKRRKRFIMMLGEEVVAATASMPSSNDTQDEIDRYQSEKGIPITADPLKWWKENGSRYPILSLMARKYLGIPATSVPCERLFSTAGMIITKQRARMTPGTCEMMIFMKSYYENFD